MLMTTLMFPLVLLIWGTMIYLVILLIRALRKYLKSSEVRAEKAAVKKSLGEAIREQRRGVIERCPQGTVLTVPKTLIALR